ncbi:hypothetical protein, partial [Enterococcus durans]|uniref:hypothetical protein n=1 Tax=Enterococcus durans TaxID=53345 RepID=UPI001FBB7E33
MKQQKIIAGKIVNGCLKIIPTKRDRDKSCLGLRNWIKKRTIRFLYCSLFLKFPKNLTFGRRLFERGWDR